MCITCKQVEMCSTSLVILEMKIKNHKEIPLHTHKDGCLKGKKKVRSIVKGLENSFQGGFLISWASVVAQMVNNLPGMQETGVQSLGGEDPLEKRMATHSSTLSWEIPWTEAPGGYSPWDCKELDMTE